MFVTAVVGFVSPGTHFTNPKLIGMHLFSMFDVLPVCGLNFRAELTCNHYSLVTNTSFVSYHSWAQGSRHDKLCSSKEACSFLALTSAFKALLYLAAA